MVSSPPACDIRTWRRPSRSSARSHPRTASVSLPAAQPDPIAFQFALPVLFRLLPGGILAAQGPWTVLLRGTRRSDLDAGRHRSPSGDRIRAVVDRERQVPVDAESQPVGFQLQPMPRLPCRIPTAGGEQEKEENREPAECVDDAHGITSVPCQHSCRSVASASRLFRRSERCPVPIPASTSGHVGAIDWAA